MNGIGSPPGGNLPGGNGSKKIRDNIKTITKTVANAAQAIKIFL